MKNVGILGPLRHRPFRLLFAGQLISDIGDWLDYLAVVTLVVFHWQFGARGLAAVALAMALPTVVCSPIAGVLADRWPRKAVMVACDIARALLVLGLAFTGSFYAALALVALKMAVSSLFSPARMGAVRTLVPADDLLAATSLSHLSLQLGKIAGPALGGLLVAVTTPRVAFLVDAVTFLLSAVCLALLPLGRTAAGSAAEQQGGEPVRPPGLVHIWVELRAGLHHIRRQSILAVAVASVSLALFLIFAFDGLGPLALQSLGANEAQVGLAIGLVGAGTALAAVVIGQQGMRLGPIRLMALGKLLAGAQVALVGLAVTGHWTGAGSFLLPVWLGLGAGAAAIIVPYGHVLQTETPPELMGRVAGTTQALQTVGQLLGPVAGAALAEAFGVGFVFLAGGLALSGFGLLVLLSPVGRKAQPAAGQPLVG